MKALLLFDIDGTLIDSEGAGLESLRDGLFEAFPDREHLPFPPLDLGGATDGSVISFLFEHFEIEDHEHHRKLFFDAYTLALEGTLRDFRERGKGQALPGASELLEVLGSEYRDYAVGLLTGNTEAGARIKLRHFGLDHHFSFGAFGDDHPDRNELGPIAVHRAWEAIGHAFEGENAIIIGDTVRDIDCARAFGARVIAVATGTASPVDLEAAEPDLLLEDLSDLSAALSGIERLVSSSDHW